MCLTFVLLQPWLINDRLDAHDAFFGLRQQSQSFLHVNRGQAWVALSVDFRHSSRRRYTTLLPHPVYCFQYRTFLVIEIEGPDQFVAVTRPRAVKGGSRLRGTGDTASDHILPEHSPKNLKKQWELRHDHFRTEAAEGLHQPLIIHICVYIPRQSALLHSHRNLEPLCLFEFYPLRAPRPGHTTGRSTRNAIVLHCKIVFS